jgi:PhnB protein
MLTWNPYLAFNGKCEAAFKFYEKALGGKLVAMMKQGEFPNPDQPPANPDLIMHARLIVGNQVLMGGDCPSGMPYDGIKGCSVAIQAETPAEAEKVFNALSAGATIMMPLQATFWAAAFGMLTDQFGVPWMVNCEKKA